MIGYLTIIPRVRVGQVMVDSQLGTFVKTTDFQLVFNFEQTRTVTILGEQGIMHGSYTMMAKPIRALELNYPMIQVLIKSSIARHHVKVL